MLTGLELCLFNTVVGFFDLSYRRICIPLSVVSLSHLCLVQYSLWNQGFYNVFLLQPSSSVSSLPLNLWYIFISDCSLKLLSIFIKSVSLLCLSKTLDCYSMGSLLCFLEYIFLFLRHIPPGILWIYFLVELNWKLQGILAGRIFVCLLYCILKVCIMLSLCKEFMKFSRSMICTKVSTGLSYFFAIKLSLVLMGFIFLMKMKLWLDLSVLVRLCWIFWSELT
ncbi:unnamed protein product [Schistosoma intercalatum]|nr:unnamed protein product [Schistosoma intercalatum]